LATELPTFSDLYDRFEAEVVDDPDTKLNDFSEGSVLDAFAGVTAIAGRSIHRWISRRLQRRWIDTAPDEALEQTAVDYYGPDLARRDGETAASYRQRVEDYRADGIHRGTPDALAYYAEQIDGVVASRADQNRRTGITTVHAAYTADTTDPDAVQSSFYSDLEKWRMAGGMVNIETHEDTLP